MPNLPEILAPVGNWEMCQAAVHNGADAVYVGFPNFNARGRAKILGLQELKDIIDYCHLYGVKVYIACNVLVFESELPTIAADIQAVTRLGPDAFIVQDIGLARLIKFLNPQQTLHASTQMTITNADAIACTADLNFDRYILGREVSIKETAKIHACTTKELEVFVHGALCVSYSGQCLTSESIGGRSANRGQCAQSCRWAYDLVVDGETRPMGDKRYLVSPQDLCGIDDLESLIEAGVTSFKIEGRLKSPQYVAQVVQSYRKRLSSPESDSSRLRDDMAVTYSRGFFNGWLDGVDHQRLVNGSYCNHHGLALGQVVSRHNFGVLVSAKQQPNAGDGVVFCDFEKQQEIGGPVFEVLPKPAGHFELRFANNFDLGRVKPGMQVFLNSKPQLEHALSLSYQDPNRLKRLPIQATIRGSLGEPLELELRDADGNCATVRSATPIQAARKNPIRPEAVAETVGALGRTCFILDKISVTIPENAFIQEREIKRLKQVAVQDLMQLRQQIDPPQERSAGEIAGFLEAPQNSRPAAGTQAELTVLIRNQSQIEALAGLKPALIYLDYEFGKEYAESLNALRAMGHQVGIATTRILKPGEYGHLKQILRLKPDAVLVRNLGALHYFRDSHIPLVGDFSLNLANSLSATWARNQGLQRICPSYDLNEGQLISLLEKFDPSCCEVVVHQYMPAFHMEHCVFAAFLSKGSSFRDCGRPCERHRVELRDPDGRLHPLKPDAECRNTMFNGVPQSGLRLISKLSELGLKFFRLEALNESAAELRVKIELYHDLLSGRAQATEVLAKLGSLEQYGVSEGQLFRIGDYRARQPQTIDPLVRIAD